MVLISNIANKTVTAELVEKATVVVGGSDPTKFVPNINFSFDRKVKDEFFLNINAKDIVVNNEKEILSEISEIKIGDRTERYYIDDNGNLEYEIIFDKKPKSNVIELDISCSGTLTFHKQISVFEQFEQNNKDMTWEAYQVAVTQDEKALNSYCIYCDKRDNEYKIGKVAVLERPFCIDKNNNKIWMDQNIVIEKGFGIWKLIIPEKIWDDETLYPIIIGPTIGSTAAPTGGTYNGDNLSYLSAVSNTASADSEIEATVIVYAHTAYEAGSFGKQLYVSFYDNNTGNGPNGANDMMGSAVIVGSPVDDGFSSGNITIKSGDLIDSGSDYYPAASVNGTGTGGLNYDVVGGTNSYYITSKGILPDPWEPYLGDSWRYGLYVEYDEAGDSTLLPSKLNQGQAIDNLDLIQQNVLAIDSLNQSQAIDYIDLIQANIIIISDLDQNQTIENLDLIQQNLLLINPIDQNQALDNLDLIQANILVINDIDQSHSIENIILQTGIVLQINDIAQSQTLENIDLIQANVLAIGDIDQNQSIDNITLSVGILLQIADIAQNQNIDAINLIQQSTISIDDIEQVQTIDNIILDAGVILQIADIIQSQSIDNLNLSQANTLAINDLIQSQTIDTITFARLEGKVTITFVLSKPGISQTLRSPGVTFKGE